MKQGSALVVLSGGQDSVMCLGLAMTQFQEVHAITFNYGQKHVREIEAARTVGRYFGVVSHQFVDVGPILHSTSPLVNPDERLETYKTFDEMVGIIGDRVEKTFVPMRNAFFLTVAANRAIALGCYNLVTGVCEADTANYPDCRSEFIAAQERTINAALGLNLDSPEPPFKIHAPLIALSKAESVKLSRSIPGVYKAWAYSHTAYDGSYPPVGHDHATMLRAQGFLEGGLPDPLVVRANWEGLMELPNTPNYEILESLATGLDELEALVGAKPYEI